MKSELLEAIAQEYQNLGRPLDAQSISPEQAVQLVAESFNGPSTPGGASGSSAFGVSAGHAHGTEAAEATGEEEGPQASLANAVYTAECSDGEWFLNAWDGECNLMAQAALPAPPDGFYFISMREDQMCLFIEDEWVPCGIFLESLTHSSTTLPAGVAATLPADDDEDRGPVVD